MAEVTALEFCFSTPRISMHMCSASITTATPRGCSTSLIVWAIWVVSRSCTWSRRLNISTSRGIFDSPTILLRRHVRDVALAKKWQEMMLAEL